MTHSLPTRMQLLVIRHGIAEEAETFATSGLDDSRRPLTKPGKRKMKEVAAGLREIVETIDVIGASPLLRAQQTAEIVAKAYGDLPVDTVQALSPESDPSALVGWLEQHESAKGVAIVGHEPHLGKLVSWLMTGVRDSRVAMSKGGAALLELSSPVTASGGTLEWLLTASQLRRIGK
ncbi:MAG: phosphohistidine phosphatase SixA [Gemmatimonadota bacterium]|nr:phosphohistidine phosphatase SixA [Gemmatimonadota bacterium]